MSTSEPATPPLPRREAPLVSDRVGGIFLGLCSVFWFGAGIIALIGAIVLWWGTTIDCNDEGMCVMAKGFMGIGATIATVLTTLLVAAGIVTVLVAVRFARSRLVNRWIVVVPARAILLGSAVASIWLLVDVGFDAGSLLWPLVVLGLLSTPVALTRLRAPTPVPTYPSPYPTPYPMPGQPAVAPWINAPIPTRTSSEPGRPTNWSEPG